MLVGLFTYLIALMSYIQAKCGLAGDDIAGIRMNCDLSHRCHQTPLLTRILLNNCDELAGRAERITAHLHRHGTGMTGLAVEAHREAVLPDDSGDDAQWQVTDF